MFAKDYVFEGWKVKDLFIYTATKSFGAIHIWCHIDIKNITRFCQLMIL